MTMLTIRRREALIYAAVGCLQAPALAVADTAWPSKPLRIIAGGVASVTDVRSRWLAERLSTALGQPVVIVNTSNAAGGNVAAAEVARAAPDGYTLLAWHQGTAAINPHLYAKAGFDALTSFAPITRFGHGPLMLTVHPSLGVHTVKELVALATSKPGALNFGSPGVGTPPHIASELFKRAAQIDAVHVPYGGGGALMAAMLGGQLSWSMDGPTVQLPHVRSGALRALAVSGARRIAAAPDVPTLAEAGVPGVDYEGWTGYAAPAGTPESVIARLYTEIAKIAATAEASEWFASRGSEAGPLAPQAFAEFVRGEHARFGKLIRDAGWRAQ